MSDTTTKEDGNLAQALEWLNAPREVLTAQQAAEQEAAWMDATLDAAGFFALEHVTPVQAAMLLCRFSPHDSAESEAESCTTDCTSPDDFKRLRLTFASIDQNRPARRSLLDWMDIAAGAGRAIHPWALRYARLHGLYGPPRPEAEPESAPAQLVVNVNMVATTVHKPTPAPVQQSEAAPVEHPLNEAPTPDEPAQKRTRAREKRLTWLDVAGPYITGVMRDGQYATGKELFNALEERAGPDSPFDKGKGGNRASLFVREIGQPVALKTMQTNFKKLREMARNTAP